MSAAASWLQYTDSHVDLRDFSYFSDITNSATVSATEMAG